MTANDVLWVLADLFLAYGIPEHSGELFYTLKEAQILVANWRRLYNGLRPHGSVGQRPSAPETIIWPGFSLADYGPPSLTSEVNLALT